MGIYAVLKSHDDMFSSLTGAPPTIVNDLVSQTSEQKKTINETIYTTNGDVYNNVPTCQCGEKKGKFRVGAVCNNCHTPVREPIEEYLQSLVWIRQPQGVNKLISPHVWLMLRRKFTLGGQNGFDTLTYLTDPWYKYQDPNPRVTRLKETLEEEGLNVRGYNNFVTRFDEYMEFLFNSPIFKPSKRTPVDDLYYLLKKEKNNYFSSYIPIPNKSLLIIENTNFGTYIDASLTQVINAVRLMTGIDDPEDVTLSIKTKESRVAKALNCLSDYYYQVYREVFSPKPGIYRKHVYGTRVDYSFRAVISSLSGKHRYDEIHVPWAVGVNVLYNHIVSKLFKRGFSPMEAFSFINKYNLEYNELMEEILNELIHEAGDKGIPCLGNRNPSLGRGSIQRLYITKFKTNPQDFTVSLSLLVVREFNADFDGDE